MNNTFLLIVVALCAVVAAGISAAFRGLSVEEVTGEKMAAWVYPIVVLIHGLFATISVAYFCTPLTYTVILIVLGMLAVINREGAYRGTSWFVLIMLYSCLLFLSISKQMDATGATKFDPVMFCWVVPVVFAILANFLRTYVLERADSSLQ